MVRKRALILVAAALLASFGFTSVASADSVHGTGSLTAEGDGIAFLRGNGTVDLSGNGILWINDLADDATIEVTGAGEKEEFPDGWIQYAGFNGTAHVEGTRIIVVIAGVDVDLSAEGRGLAILWGHGTYEVNGQAGGWSTWGLGTRVRIAAP